MIKVLICAFLLTQAPEQPTPPDKPEVKEPVIKTEPVKSIAQRLAEREIFQIYRPADFYYYLAPGKTSGLILAPRLAILFPQEWIDKQRGEYLRLFHENVASVSNVTLSFDGIASHVLVDLIMDENMRIADRNNYIVNVLNLAPVFNDVAYSEQTIQVLPVVMVEGRQYFPTNQIQVTAKPPITADLLRQRLELASQPLGDFKVTNLVKSRNFFYLTIEELKWPSNVLVLANLLSDQPWADFAKVVLTPLYPPLEASFDIMPDGAPTLGERRTLVLKIIVSDPAYKIDRDLLPQLGRGTFIFSQMGTGKFLQDFFFRAEEGVVEEFTEEERLVTLVKWPFYILEPGNYKLPIIEIPYVVQTGEEENKFSKPVNSVKVYVGSIILEYPEINDIQPMKFYRFLASARDDNLAAENKSFLEENKLLFGNLAIGFALAIAVSTVIVANKGNMKMLAEGLRQRREDNKLLSDLRKVTLYLYGGDANFDRAKTERGYAQLERLARKTFVIFYGMPANITRRDLEKKKPDYFNAEEYTSALIVFDELEKRLNPNYIPSKEDRRALADNLMLLREGARTRKRRTRQ